MAELLAIIPKSHCSEFRIMKDQYYGRDVIDIRVWYIPKGQKEFVRSRKGVTFAAKNFSRFRQCLNSISV